LPDAGAEFGISVSIVVLTAGRGPASIFQNRAVRQFIEGVPFCLMLDDVYYGGNTADVIADGGRLTHGGVVLAAWVKDPRPFGWLKTDATGRIIDIIEKPKDMPSAADSFLVQAGMYFFGPEVLDLASELRPSARNEYEISDLVKLVLQMDQLKVSVFEDTDESPYLWQDAGTPPTLLSLGIRVRDLQETQTPCLVGSPHLQAIANGWIRTSDVLERCMPLAAQGVTYYKTLAQVLGSL
jgi:glucose-1-phosphate thymidylyltransferase